MRIWRAPRPALAAAVLALSLAAAAPAPAHAEHPRLLVPAPAGTTWSIVAGYNTATHLDDDPHAVDLVREDAPTAGTPVLAPLPATVTWRSSSCLVLRDSHGFATLLCHLFPRADLAVGDAVGTGSLLGEVAPAGAAGNDGLAHIHVAVHYTLGAGQLQATIPLTGAYALEGRDLPPTNTFNAYAGEQFLSTNAPGAATSSPETVPPSPPQTEPGAGLTEPAPSTPAESDTEAAQQLHAGWNLAGWTGASSIEEAIAPIAGSVDAAFTFDATAQAFRRYTPDAPAALNTLSALQVGDALLIHVTAADGVRWPRPPIAEPRPLPLAAGFNLVTWTGARQSTAAATAGLEGVLVALYAFDAATQRFSLYRPDAPAFLSDLDTLEPGQGLWVAVREAALWTPPPLAPDAPPPEPDAQTLPQARVLGPGCLNLRPAPTTQGTLPITCLAVGTIIDLTGETALDAAGNEWLAVRVDGLTGWVAAQFVARDPEAVYADGTVDGEATFYSPSLHGNVMYCGGTYNRFDPTIAAAVSWPCGTRLRIWRGDRFVDVVVQDGGLLPPNHVDLSEAAFQQIGLLAEGRLSVRVEVLDGPDGG